MASFLITEADVEELKSKSKNVRNRMQISDDSSDDGEPEEQPTEYDNEFINDGDPDEDPKNTSKLEEMEQQLEDKKKAEKKRGRPPKEKVENEPRVIEVKARKDNIVFSLN